MTQKQPIDWKELGFAYRDTRSHVRAVYTNGSWGEPEVCEEPLYSIHVAATALHYGQACFEGLKAFTRADDSIAMFRPDENAKRLERSARRLVMEPPPMDLFLKCAQMVIENNRDYVPPYGTGASFYLRPLLVGTTPRIGLQPASEFLFLVLGVPVGPYYKHGFHPVKAIVQENYDRAAPRGVGNIKAAGNYAAGLIGELECKAGGYPIALYLDSERRQFVDEFGTSNFFGITGDKHYVTPQSESILPSITNMSLQEIARDFGYAVEHRKIPVGELSTFTEVGACGTATVITPIFSITHGNTVVRFGEENKAGEFLTRLYEEIQGIQFGDRDDRHGWMYRV